MIETKHISQFNSNILKKPFGVMPNGESVCLHHLINENGMELHLIDYGATVTAIKIPLKNGKLIDVALGFETLDNYIDSFNLPAAPYFGATVGRFAGRINNGALSLNGKMFQLDQNNNQHTLHGGTKGFSQTIWKAEECQTYEGLGITFSHFSPNNDAYFPGNLEVKVTYILTENNEIKIKYHAVSDQDTVINLTHHSYFNLDGHQGDIKNQDLFVDAAFVLETNNENIPTGRVLDLSQHLFQFNPPKKCPLTIDNTFVLQANSKLASSLSSAKNGIKMNVYTDQPSVHIYVGGNCFNKIEGKDKANYHALSGICFETQNFPDAPNHAHFPNAVLRKDEFYTQQTIYKFEMLALENDI